MFYQSGAPYCYLELGLPTFRYDRDFWDRLLGHTYYGWLGDPHLDTWAQYLYKSRVATARWSAVATWMMTFFDNANSTPETFADGQTAPWPAWWTVDYVMMPVNLNNAHWVLAILDLVNWELKVYDSLSPGALDQRVVPILERFQTWLPSFLDRIEYWKNSLRDKSTFQGLKIVSVVVPKQSGILGDCGIWVMIHMLNKIKGRHMEKSRDASGTARNFRLRVASAFYSYRLLTEETS